MRLFTRLLLAASLIWLGSCNDDDESAAAQVATPAPTATVAPKPTPTPQPFTGSARIAAFNIQVFGRSKVSDDFVLSTLIRIVREYDAILIQEIRDSSGEAIRALHAWSDSQGFEFELLVSERLGRTTSKEQYALIYDPNVVEILDVYTDPDLADVFEREPYVVYVSIKGLTLGLITLHAKPDDAVVEIDALDDIYDDFVRRTGDADALILGDLNADCSFASDAELAMTRLCNVEKYSWLIPDSADTTVSATDCAYDRIIAAGEIAKMNLSRPAILDFAGSHQGEPLDVSDHYPVEITLVEAGNDLSGLSCIATDSASGEAQVVELPPSALATPGPAPGGGPQPTPTPTPNTCPGTKMTCGQMSSCEEARAYLACGLTQLDGDGDGTPCEGICGN